MTSATHPNPNTNPTPIPPTSQMLRTHTLAHETITRHDPLTQENAIFDSSMLSFLARFVAAPSTKDVILREHDMVDAEGDRPGTRANTIHGSLVGYCVAKHGTEDPALDEKEIEMLREWFDVPVWRNGGV